MEYRDQNKIAIYDFCQTLVDFETADEFVRFIVSKRKTIRNIGIELFRKCLIKIKIMEYLEEILSKGHNISSLNKRLILSEIKGISRLEIEKYANEFYIERIRPHIIRETLLRLIKEKENGFTIVIVSASYMPIINCFKHEYNVDCIITNDFAYDDSGMFLGDILRLDCLGKMKVDYFYEKYPDVNLKDIESISYGDSKSDIFILNETRKGVVVSRNIHKEWVENSDLEEIIWD